MNIEGTVEDINLHYTDEKDSFSEKAFIYTNLHEKLDQKNITTLIRTAQPKCIIFK